VINISTEHKPPVSPSEYDREYFLTDCGGYRDFIDHHGLVIEKRMSRSLRVADIKPGMQVLDIGSGRGELVFRSAIKKANVIGIDYSADALRLANELKSIYPRTGDRMDFIRGSATCLPFNKKSFDRALMLDVVEHLHEYELDRMLLDTHMLLKDDGLIIIHTSPNKLFYDHGYQLIRPVLRLVGTSGLKKDIRTSYEKKMHINEQTSRSLRKSLKKAGFNSIVVVSDTDNIENIIKENVPDGKISALLSRIVTYPYLSWLFGNSIYAVAWKAGHVPDYRRIIKSLGNDNRDDQGELMVSDVNDVCEDLIKDRVRMNDIGNLGKGWHALELWPDQTYIRWSTKEAYAYVKNSDKNTLKIKFFSTFENELNILINAKLVKTIAININSWQVVECKDLEKGILEVKLTLDKTSIPEETLFNGDMRELGIAVESIWLEG
jgi:ubiquinone/menaquinone biosynthesis C-methylase UbiE